MDWFKALTKPRIFIPILLSTAMLAFLLGISDASFVVARVRSIPLITLAISFALAVAYLVLKWHLFHQFLKRLLIRTTWRQSALAFAISEMAIPLPAGDYAQNYVLRRIANVDFSTSSAATTAIFAVEAGISLVVVAALGIPGFDWLRPAIFGLFVATAVLMALFIRVERSRELAGRLLQLGPLRRVGPEIIELVEGLRDLLTLGSVARAVPLVLLYLLSLLAVFYLVAIEIGVPQFTFLQAVTVYLFAMAVEMLLPFSTQVGIIEGAGFVAMQAWGHDLSMAVAALLGFRIVWTGAIWLAGGITVLLLWRELERVT